MRIVDKQRRWGWVYLGVVLFVDSNNDPYCTTLPYVLIVVISVSTVENKSKKHIGTEGAAADFAAHRSPPPMYVLRV